MRIDVSGHVVAAGSASKRLGCVRERVAKAMQVVPQMTYGLVDEATIPAAEPQPASVYTRDALRRFE